MHVHIVQTLFENLFFLLSDLTYTKSHDTLTYQKYKKKVKKNGTLVYAQTALHFALNIAGISHMFLFVICFSN
jgi:hypothetical protein